MDNNDVFEWSLRGPRLYSGVSARAGAAAAAAAGAVVPAAVYVVRYNATATGLYTLRVTLNGKPLPLGAASVVRVWPAAADPASSVGLGAPATATAGVVSNFVVQVRAAAAAV